ncbi:MAG: hypothetical protein ACP5HS_13680 [Anaerolineae bacterium]
MDAVGGVVLGLPPAGLEVEEGEIREEMDRPEDEGDAGRPLPEDLGLPEPGDGRFCLGDILCLRVPLMGRSLMRRRGGLRLPTAVDPEMR